LTKHFITSFSSPADKEPIIEGLDKIAKRENISFSELVNEIIEDYVKKHSAGNPNFEISKWVEEPEFMADPAVRESNDKWERYLASCDEKDLAQLMGTFKKRLEQTNHAWHNKYFERFKKKESES
jgi:poly-D-alanine transfer protein DltD